MSKRILECDQQAVTTTATANTDTGGELLSVAPMPDELYDIFPLIWIRMDIFTLYNLVKTSKVTSLRVLPIIEEMIKEIKAVMLSIYNDDNLALNSISQESALIELSKLNPPMHILGYCALLVELYHNGFSNQLQPITITRMTAFKLSNFNSIIKFFGIMMFQHDLHTYIYEITPSGSEEERSKEVITPDTPIKNVYYRKKALVDCDIKEITTFSYTPESRENFMKTTMNYNKKRIKRVILDLNRVMKTDEAKASRYYENTKAYHTHKYADHNTPIRNIAISNNAISNFYGKDFQEYHHFYHYHLDKLGRPSDSSPFFVCKLGKKRALYIQKFDDLCTAWDYKYKQYHLLITK
jgi:hypothetical protein